MTMQCPICRQQLKTGWLTTDEAAAVWFTGVFTCPTHAEMRLSGFLDVTESPQVKTHIPECPSGCGIYPVLQLSSTRWACVECGCSIQLRNGRLATYPHLAALAVAREFAAV